MARSNPPSKPLPLRGVGQITYIEAARARVLQCVGPRSANDFLSIAAGENPLGLSVTLVSRLNDSEAKANMCERRSTDMVALDDLTGRERHEPPRWIPGPSLSCLHSTWARASRIFIHESQGLWLMAGRGAEPPGAKDIALMKPTDIHLEKDIRTRNILISP